MNELSKVPIPWIRIHYAYPTGLTNEVIRAFKDSKNILPYFDLPLQHSHSDVLKSMNRPWQASLNESILEKIREENPSDVKLNKSKKINEHHFLFCIYWFWFWSCFRIR